MKKTIFAAAAIALAMPAAPALADGPPPWAPAHGKRAKDNARYYERYHTREAPRYRTSGNGIRYWRGDDGRYYCHRSNGTTGLIVGAAAGALAGRAIDTRGDRTTGTVVGAAVGALLGKEIDQGRVSCR
ncbi:glycine zipper 2TM domain-containing protein [Altererythrobacter salegens]|uniref:17 kDa surface antigen n=1 Tax=Croceibacterium salegens TaxID=1737568 RepID=A0A6I4STM6_9SPHN|nr:glycine zipper 2TM domain-containing protein [Croceibacterium salegens]MXO59213.1 glycine zipper 2TM domain-containing protein [Croceibacterium salegens]